MSVGAPVMLIAVHEFAVGSYSAPTSPSQTINRVPAASTYPSPGPPVGFIIDHVFVAVSYTCATSTSFPVEWSYQRPYTKTRGPMDAAGAEPCGAPVVVMAVQVLFDGS